MTRPSPVDALTMLPHSGHARLVERIVDAGSNALICQGRIGVENAFARSGRVPGFVLLELAAQAAAIEALASIEGVGQRPHIGYLARARGVQWSAEPVPTGSALEVSVMREDAIPPLYMYRARITLDSSEVFSGEMTLYIDEDAD